MTKQEKIDILKKMMWLNFKMNFNKRWTIGLCTILTIIPSCKYHSLIDDIPEIFKYRKKNTSFYWWSYNKRFKSWWERHLAIWRTIQDLKKQ